jgi:alcohol dehydrogenase class IV
MEMGLKEVGAQEQDFERIAEGAMQSCSMRNNPIEATPEWCIAVLEAPL